MKELRTKHKLNNLHKKKLQNNRGVFKSFPIEQYLINSYPNLNISLKEVEKIKSLSKKNNIDLIYDADKSQIFFQNELKKLGVTVDLKKDKKLISLLDNISPIIIELKYTFNRPRPNEISEIDYVYLDSAQTPSYPSGHSTQSQFIGLYLSDKYPTLKKQILNISHKIGISRLLARIHYPSDHSVGKNLGSHLYYHYKKFTPQKNII